MGQRKRESIDYLYDILDAIVKIEKFTNGIGFDEFSKDYKTIYAVVRAFEIIGEASKRVSDSVKKKYENIPWREMAGMRDKLIHGYFGIDIKHKGYLEKRQGGCTIFKVATFKNRGNSIQRMTKFPIQQKSCRNLS